MLKKALFTLSLLASFGTAMATDLPDVVILATGGTIAGTAASSTQMTGYKSGNLGVQTLIEAVPAIKEIADVSGEQIVNVGSPNLTEENLLKIAKRCNELLADSKVKGIVITHGTDTLEETAYFLNLTIKSDKPVVIVGSMRPATAISADGPVNLLNAVKVAASDEAVGKGVLVAMNDEINGARDVTKTNTTLVSTFKAPELGTLGYIAAGQPQFFKESTRRHTSKSEFDISKVNSLPRVDIVYSYLCDDRVATDAFVKAGAKGIVHAGSGNGSISNKTYEGLLDAVSKGVVIVRSSRVGNGVVTKSLPEWTEKGLIESGTLNPQKSRILLQLALTRTSDPKEIQRIFREY